jgi:hypothetical protein
VVDAVLWWGFMAIHEPRRWVLEMTGWWIAGGLWLVKNKKINK